MKGKSSGTRKKHFEGFVPPPFDVSAGDEAARNVIPIFSDITDDEWRRLAGGIQRSHSPFFRARSGEILASGDTILLGLGERERFHPDILFSAFRGLGAQLLQGRPESICIRLSTTFFEEVRRFGSLHSDESIDPFPSPRHHGTEKRKRETPDYLLPFSEGEAIFQAIYGLYLGGYSTGILKTEEGKKRNGISEDGGNENRRVRVLVHANGVSDRDLQLWIREARETAELANAFRYSAALPGNYLNPAQYEAYAREIASRYGLKFRVIKGPELEKRGFGGVIAVGKGSAVPPRVIVLEYPGHQKGEPVVLVGKGITFDTGGISLKPPADMHEMKFDMSGSGLVLHSIALAARLKRRMPVVAVIGLAENMPDGNATKPGDVYTAYNGITVEVQNTDAEGRLVLGDLLAFACDSFKPAVLLDFATLTGACVIALGHEATGYMTSSEGLAREIEAACRRSLDRGWRLPHWSVYDEGLKSDVADLRNIAGRAAGTVTGMRFLSRFVKPGIPWAHLDIAGTAYRTSGADYVRGPSGWGMRFLRVFLQNLEGKRK